MVENSASAKLVRFGTLRGRGFAFVPILGMLMPILGMFKPTCSYSLFSIPSAALASASFPSASWLWLPTAPSPLGSGHVLGGWLSSRAPIAIAPYRGHALHRAPVVPVQAWPCSISSFDIRGIRQRNTLSRIIERAE